MDNMEKNLESNEFLQAMADFAHGDDGLLTDFYIRCIYQNDNK